MHDIDKTQLEYSQPPPGLRDQEGELAAELLSVQSEGELEQFIGNIVSRVGSTVRNDIVPALTSALKPVISKALPLMANILDEGDREQLTEYEAESGFENEFEMAKKMVRVAKTAAGQTLKLAPRVPLKKAADAAVLASTRRHAPYVIPRPNNVGATPGGKYGGRGRWFRRGNNIVIVCGKL